MNGCREPIPGAPASGPGGAGDARRLDALLIAMGTGVATAGRISSAIGLPPLGAAYLASVLRREGLTVRIADLNVPGWTRDRLKRCLELERPRIVGLSCMTESYRNAVRLGSWIRKTSPDTWVVAGGPHVSFLDEESLHTGAFQIVVRGEGEETVSELLPLLARGGVPNQGIRGISYMDGGRVVKAPSRGLIADLDTIPWPARDLLPLDRYGTPGALLTGRGCPGRCLFCSASAMAGGRYRPRHEDAVMDEIRYLSELGMEEIAFLDDTLTGDRERLERLLDRLDRSGLRFGWTCESRIEAVEPALLERMARLGCHGIQYGIESGSAGSQERVGKGRNEAGVEGILQATNRAGITPVCTFILGLPWEDASAVNRTIEFGLQIQERYLATVGFGVLVCYPGTPFWKRPGEYGLRRRVKDYDKYAMHLATVETRHLGLHTLQRLQFEATTRQVRSMPRALIELNAGVEDLSGEIRKSMALVGASEA